MKCLIALIIISLAYISAVYSQTTDDDPLGDSYVIQAGGGNEIVAINNSQVEIYKYVDNRAIFDKDTLVKTLTYNTSGNIQDICTDHFDAQLSEILIGAESSGQPKWALLKPSQDVLSVDAKWDKTVEGDVTGPAIYQPGYSVISPVLVKSGNFDADANKEFVLAYWAEDNEGGGTVRLLLYNVDDSLNVTSLGEIMDQKITAPVSTNLCEDQLSIFDIECADFNGDGVLDLAVLPQGDLA